MGLVNISILPLNLRCPLTSFVRSSKASQEEALERPRLGHSGGLPLGLTAPAVDPEMRGGQPLFLL